MTTKPAPATNTPATDLPRKVVAFAPAACTLPTAERPLRASEFVDLLGTQVIATHLVNNQHTRFELAPLPEVAARAADLFAREARCCSFFTFTLTIDANAARVAVVAPDDGVPLVRELFGR